MDIIILAVGITAVILQVVIIVRLGGDKSGDMDKLAGTVSGQLRDSIGASSRELRKELSDSVQSSTKNMGDSIVQVQKALGDGQTARIEELEKKLAALQADTDKRLGEIRQVVDENLQTSLGEKMKTFSQLLTDNQKQAADAQMTQLTEMDKKLTQTLDAMSKTISDRQTQSGKAVNDSLVNLEKRFQTLESSNNERLENMRLVMMRQLTSIQEDNEKKLGEIQKTVNEKLESRLQESFKLVSERLEQVYKGLGEMQTIAAGVGDLKKVLSNVKTRGILGEIQLGSILEEILAPELYEREIPTIPGSRNHVEYAVKLPGTGEGEHILLPIDSKFPGDTFAALQDAYGSGDRARIEAARKTLETTLKQCAGDIRDKYVSPPHTTNFGIMFLPFEGLYAEAVNLGMVEKLQRDYSVTITGPSTMAAMLNSLQMGFRTLTIQKRSHEVWQILGSVKKEFVTFQDVLDKARKHLHQVDSDLETLVGTRTRQINRQLDKIQLSDETAPDGLPGS